MIMNLKEAGGGPVCHGIEHRGSYSARKEANNTGETGERSQWKAVWALHCPISGPISGPNFSPSLPLHSMELEGE